MRLYYVCLRNIRAYFEAHRRQIILNTHVHVFWNVAIKYFTISFSNSLKSNPLISFSDSKKYAKILKGITISVLNEVKPTKKYSFQEENLSLKFHANLRTYK
jgi:hypothetical protein